jgi:2,4-dienoyl-CoA reductase-like NADH-dependent reductase (Old Yellow Enzyme family)
MLFESISVRNLQLKNRLVAEPIVSNSGGNDGALTVRSLEIYEGYARSGAGLVVVEQHAVHPWGRNKLSQFRLYDDEKAAALRPLTELFRRAGVPVTAQLNFSGAGASGRELLEEEDFRLVSPSGLRNPRDLIDADSEALEAARITEIVKAFASAARRAVNIAEYTGGVQIYACHGYLLGQFLSPLTNRRTDAYGGDIKNRARFLFEVVEEVRAAVPGSVVSVRLGAADRMPGQSEDGFTLRESCWIAKELASLGVDWIGVSGNHCIYGIGENDNDTAYFAPYASAIRKAIESGNGRKIPVDCAGGIRSRAKAEELLRNKVCDLVGIGRPLIKDKEFLHRMKNSY